MQSRIKAALFCALLVAFCLVASSARAAFWVKVANAQRFQVKPVWGPYQTRAEAQHLIDETDASVRSYCSIFEDPPADQPVTGPSAAQQAADEEKQRADAAQTLTQQGKDAIDRDDYDSALKYFQDALAKAPDNTAIQEAIQKTKSAIATKRQSNPEAVNKRKIDSLSQLKGLPDSDTGLKDEDIGSPDSGLKNLPYYGNSGEVKTLPLNTDPMVVDARGVPSDLDKETTEWLNGISTVPGVADRLHKGWEAYKKNDLDVSTAWLDDALNHEPNNVNLKYVVERMHIQKKLADNPKYVAAVNQAVAAIGASDTRGESVAIENARKAEGVLQAPTDDDLVLLFPGLSGLEQKGENMKQNKGVLQLPTDADLKYLFPEDMTPEQREEANHKIMMGIMLPDKDKQLNQLLEDHPELHPQLLVEWKSCVEDLNIKEQKVEDSTIDREASGLAATAARLGLPYGHIEETVAKDPSLNAQWHYAILHASYQVGIDELSATFDISDRMWQKFHKNIKLLQQTANQSKNIIN